MKVTHDLDSSCQWSSTSENLTRIKSREKEGEELGTVNVDNSSLFRVCTQWFYLGKYPLLGSASLLGLHPKVPSPLRR